MIIDYHRNRTSLIRSRLGRIFVISVSVCVVTIVVIAASYVFHPAVYIRNTPNDSLTLVLKSGEIDYDHRFTVVPGREWGEVNDLLFPLPALAIVAGLLSLVILLILLRRRGSTISKVP